MYNGGVQEAGVESALAACFPEHLANYPNLLRCIALVMQTAAKKAILTCVIPPIWLLWDAPVL
jgi:hypothetical protein